MAVRLLMRDVEKPLRHIFAPPTKRRKNLRRMGLWIIVVCEISVLDFKKLHRTGDCLLAYQVQFEHMRLENPVRGRASLNDLADGVFKLTSVHKIESSRFGYRIGRSYFLRVATVASFRD